MPTYGQIMALLDDSANAVRTSPGKFEGNEDARVGEALYALTLDGSSLDDQSGGVDEGAWYGLIGRFVVKEDDQGFFSYWVYDEEESAKVAFLGH